MRPIDANPAAFAMFGVADQELGRLSLRRIFPRREFGEIVAAVRNGGRTEFIEKGMCRRSDGTAFAVAVKGNLLSIKGQLVLFCSIRDMSAKVKAEEEMLATQAKLIQANKVASLGLMVSGISHEINNPNQCIGMNAFIIGRVWKDALPLLAASHDGDGSFLLDGVPFSEMQRTVPLLIDGIADSSRRIDAYVQRLLNFVRGDDGRLDHLIDLNSAVENATSILWYKIRSSTNSFRKELAADIPQVRGNLHQLEQVVINLVTNALNALPDKSAGIIIETGFDDIAGEVIIRCRDEGRGMDSRTLARLAEPFFTTRQDQGGTGLGVYIASSIVREHHGAMHYDSAPGAGTTVTVRFPAYLATAGSEAEGGLI
jgi:PAS domain S-box-containing protein